MLGTCQYASGRCRSHHRGDDVTRSLDTVDFVHSPGQIRQPGARHGSQRRLLGIHVRFGHGESVCKNGLLQKRSGRWPEVMSTVVDPEDKKTFPLFGDGAGAALIAADPEHDPEMPSGILAHRIAAEGILGDKLLVPGGGSRLPISQQVLDDRSYYLQMDGRCVFKWAVRLIPDIVEEMLVKSGMQLDDINLIIFHQANRRILDAAVEIIGADPEKVFVNLEKYGNTSAASIPISLHEAVVQGRVKPGSTILMAGFGSGLTWGACIFRW